MEIPINYHNLRQQIYEGGIYLNGIDMANSFLCESIYELTYRDPQASGAISKFISIDEFNSQEDALEFIKNV